MKTRFFALAALALALAACNNDNEILNNDGPVAARFIADIAPATRASGTTWTGGDRIGVTDIDVADASSWGFHDGAQAMAVEAGTRIEIEGGDALGTPRYWRYFDIG